MDNPYKKKNLTKELVQQAQRASNPNLQVIRNGSVNDAVNFAVEDFHKAQMVLARITDKYTKPYDTMPRGMQLFTHHQFFRLNAAGMTLDALGFQGVTEVMVATYPAMDKYMRETMAGWNKVIEAEGDVEKLFQKIAAEEQAQATPPANMN